jgi:hypothetical protein
VNAFGSFQIDSIQKLAPALDEQIGAIALRRHVSFMCSERKIYIILPLFGIGISLEQNIGSPVVELFASLTLNPESDHPPSASLTIKRPM